MVVLGALVVVLAVLVTVGVAADNPDAVMAEAFGRSFDGVSTGELFLIGATTGVAGALGLVLFVSGLSRRRSRRVAVKQEVKAARSERESLEEENSRLQAELEHSRTSSAAASPDTTDDDHRSAVRADVDSTTDASASEDPSGRSRTRR